MTNSVFQWLDTGLNHVPAHQKLRYEARKPLFAAFFILEWRRQQQPEASGALALKVEGEVSAPFGKRIHFSASSDFGQPLAHFSNYRELHGLSGSELSWIVRDGVPSFRGAVSTQDQNDVSTNQPVRSQQQGTRGGESIEERTDSGVKESKDPREVKGTNEACQANDAQAATEYSQQGRFIDSQDTVYTHAPLTSEVVAPGLRTGGGWLMCPLHLIPALQGMALDSQIEYAGRMVAGEGFVAIRARCRNHRLPERWELAIKRTSDLVSRERWSDVDWSNAQTLEIEKNLQTSLIEVIRFRAPLVGPVELRLS